MVEIGIIVGCIFGVVVIFGLFYVFYLRYKRERDNHSISNSPHFLEGDGNSGSNSSYHSSTDPISAIKLSGSSFENSIKQSSGSNFLDSDEKLAQLRVNNSALKLITRISAGPFGAVWYGTYDSQPVAVKTLLQEKSHVGDARHFSSEIKTLGRLNHHKIVKFIGASWTTHYDLSAITEFMDCGDLRGLLDSPTILSWKSSNVVIAKDVAEALVYLHSLDPMIVHRDLKAKNILIDSKMGAKLSNFGLSKNRTFEETMTVGVGTLRWTAPEVILGEDYDVSVDIYAFGIVLSELDTRKVPYHEQGKIADITLIRQVAKGTLKPQFTPTCPDEISKLAHACLQHDPRLRPSADQVYDRLKTMLM